MNIEELIRQSVNLSYSNSKGWLSVKCPICDDYKTRAAFKFDHNGESCVYHCFNNTSCGGAYNPYETEGVMSHNFRKVLKEFGVSKLDYEQLVFDNTLNTKQQIKQELLFEFPTFKEMPVFFHKLADHLSTDFGAVCEQYLIDRKINALDYDFYFTTVTNQRDWNYRLIIPAFRKNKVIYYQGRDILDIHTLKYKSLNAPLSDVLFNFDELSKQTNIPLLVFEGFFDGLCLSQENFVSIMSSNMTREQVYFLSTSKRKKIIVPDLQGNGFELIKQGIKHNFAISFPNLKGFKDINDAVIAKGKLYVLEQILTNVFEGYEADLRLEMYQNGLL